MPDERFEDLALKVLGGAASDEERAELNAMLAREARLREQFEELRLSWRSLAELGPLALAVDAHPEPVPAHRVEEFRTTVREHFAALRKEHAKRPAEPTTGWSWLDLFRWVALPATVAVVAIAAVVLLRRQPVAPQLAQTPRAYVVVTKGPVEIVRGQERQSLLTAETLRPGDELVLAAGAEASALTPRGAVELRGPVRLDESSLVARASDGTSPADNPLATWLDALFQPTTKILAMSLPAVLRRGEGIALYCPRDTTASLTPLIWWKAEPGKRYHVLIRDELDRRAAPFEVSGVVTPVYFAQVPAWRGRTLASDGLYRLSVRESGGPLPPTEHTFRTRAQPDLTVANDPPSRLLRTWRLLSESEPCPGDALAELLQLPPEAADSELALRLKLLLFGQLGLTDDYQATAARLGSGTNRPPSQKK